MERTKFLVNLVKIFNEISAEHTSVGASLDEEFVTRQLNLKLVNIASKAQLTPSTMWVELSKSGWEATIASHEANNDVRFCVFLPNRHAEKAGGFDMVWHFKPPKVDGGFTYYIQAKTYDEDQELVSLVGNGSHDQILCLRKTVANARALKNATSRAEGGYLIYRKPIEFQPQDTIPVLTIVKSMLSFIPIDHVQDCGSMLAKGIAAILHSIPFSLTAFDRILSQALLSEESLVSQWEGKEFFKDPLPATTKQKLEELSKAVIAMPVVSLKGKNSKFANTVRLDIMTWDQQWELEKKYAVLEAGDQSKGSVKEEVPLIPGLEEGDKAKGSDLPKPGLEEGDKAKGDVKEEVPPNPALEEGDKAKGDVKEEVPQNPALEEGEKVKGSVAEEVPQNPALEAGER